jgi:hypothetical protein
MSTYTEYFKNYYETKVKTNPEKMAKRVATATAWQKKNKGKTVDAAAKWKRKDKDKWNAYQREWAKRKRLAESEDKE